MRADTRDPFLALCAPGQMRALDLVAGPGEEPFSMAYFDSHPAPAPGAADAGALGAPRGVILLLHGLGEHAGYWRENAPALVAAGYRVVAPDLAGHGRSAKPQRTYGIEWQAALQRALLDALGVAEPVTVVGHSMGGQIAMRLAHLHPERVRALALIAPAGIETFTPTEAAWLRKMTTPQGFAGRGAAALRAHFERNVFGRWSPVAEEHLLERVALKGRPGFNEYIQAVVASVYAMLDDRAAYELESLKAPVYLLFGEDDRLVPNPVLHGGKAAAVAERARALLPNLRRLALLPGVGHMPQIEALHETNALILDAARLAGGAGLAPDLDPTPDPTPDPAPAPDPLGARTSRSSRMEILVKRYPNRRLYDTGRSAYITLDELAVDLGAGKRVRVEDSKTGEDITQRVLLQALLTDGQAHKLRCLPQDFLFTLLQLDDPSMLTLFGHYVRTTLSTFSTAQNILQQQLDFVKHNIKPTGAAELLSGLTSLLTSRGGKDEA